MAVEIRELIIRTEIKSQKDVAEDFPVETFKKLKYDLMQDCRRLLQDTRNRKVRKR